MARDLDVLLARIAEAEADLGRDLHGARTAFEEVVQELRSPERYAAEGRALWGLARSLLGLGETQGAVTRASDALAAFERARHAIEGSEDRVRLAVVWQEVRTAEAECVVLLAELQMRLGSGGEAEASLAAAGSVFDSLGRESTPAASSALGRMALREGRYGDAEALFRRALEAHTVEGNLAGQVGAWLQLAEVHRQEGRLAEAEEDLQAARPIAHDANSPLLVARVLAALAGVMLQVPRPHVAASLYEEALPRVRQAGDREMEGFVLLGLGLARSRSGQSDAEAPLRSGTDTLAALGHAHGVAGGLHRLSEHVLRHQRPRAALLYAVGAWALWWSVDPRRGVGQALRMVVKALAELDALEEALVAAIAREAVAGDIQPNAVEVANYYRAKLAPPLWEDLDGRSAERLLADAWEAARVRCERFVPDTERGVIALDALRTVPGAESLMRLADSGMLSGECSASAGRALTTGDGCKEST